MQTASHIGHRQRIKEKYEKSGMDGWLDYEVLELALTYAIPRKDTKPIAKALLTRFKSLNAVLDADIKDLETINGISKHSALFLRFLKDVSVLYLERGIHNRDLLSSSQAVSNYLKIALKGLANEEFKMLFLDNRNQLIAMESLKSGTVNCSVVFPRQVVERALYHHAVGVIIAHNHPAGTLAPSVADQQITRAIFEALQTVDIKLLDHIIIGGNAYYSFKESQLEFEDV